MIKLSRALKFTLPALLLAGQVVAQTQEMKLTSARPYGAVPGGYVGPYQAQVTSAPGQPYLDIFCVDYKNSISVGTVWTTNVSSLSGDLSKTRFNDRIKYQQAAWLALQFKSSAKTEWASIHGAIWNITSPGSPSIAGNVDAQTLLAQAQDVANYSTIDLNQWVVLTDVNTDWANRNSAGVAMGGKQEYLAFVTPEPATMILLGTGLAGVAAARRRRRNGIGDADLT